MLKLDIPLPTIYDYISLGIVLSGCIGINILTGVIDITKIKNKVTTILNLSKPSDNNDYEAV